MNIYSRTIIKFIASGFQGIEQNGTQNFSLRQSLFTYLSEYQVASSETLQRDPLYIPIMYLCVELIVSDLNNLQESDEVIYSEYIRIQEAFESKICEMASKGEDNNDD